MVRVCIADLADRDELVAEISDNIYDGNDYFPMYIDRWLQDGQHFIVVAKAEREEYLANVAASADQVDSDALLHLEHQDKSEVIVGAIVIGLLDSGETADLQALRVHPLYRGAGIGRKLSTFSVAFASKLETPPKRIRMSTVSWHTASLKLHFEQGFVEHSRFGSSMASIAPGMKLSSVAVPGYNHIHRVTSLQLWSLNVGHLVPKECLFHNWEPHSWRKETLEHLEHREDMQFAVYKEQEAVSAFAIIVRSFRANGVHLFASIFCDNKDSNVLSSLALYALRTAGHGAITLNLNYPFFYWQEMDDVKDGKPDARIPPVVEALAAATPQLDWSHTYVNGHAIVLEKNLNVTTS